MFFNSPVIIEFSMELEARDYKLKPNGNFKLWHKIKLVMNMAFAEKSVSEEHPTPDVSQYVVKRKVLSCFKGVRLLQTLVILACSLVVIQQISACIRKLIDIPVTTYTHFDFNKTIVYPSVTFCREPPYKYDKMLDHGLYSHPRFTSVWANYNFSHSLDELWDDITYSEQDMFVQYGLDGSVDNIELLATTGFVFGRCYTMTPRALATLASKSAGYSVTLRHSPADIATTGGVDRPGYHVFVHYTREPFTEVEVYNGGLVQKLFVNVGETIEVKLTIDEYVKVSAEGDSCTDEANYSANICTAQYVWDVVGQKVGCSGPWMISNLPRCKNHTEMRNLISEYMTTYEHHDCDSCPRFCRSFLYSCLVTDRQALYTWDSTASMWISRTADATFETQLYIYFNSMMVSVYEERYNYDWNLFISDLGGSIGFLLGLSVIGLMKIIGKTWDQYIHPFVKNSPRKSSVTGSTATVDVASIKTTHPNVADSEDRREKIGVF